MKGTVFYCDRCYAEGVSTPAGHKAWIRTTLGGRTVRLDVCDKHLAILVGSPNGAAPPKPEKAADREWTSRQRKIRATYERLLPFIAKNTRFSLEDATADLGKDHHAQRISTALRLLLDDGKVERHAQGIYQRPGFTIPEPASVEQAAAAIQKIVTTRPGILGNTVAALAGIERIQLWRNAREYLVKRKLLRSKGTKSVMRLYPR